MGGLAAAATAQERGYSRLPAIMITGQGDVPMAVGRGGRGCGFIEAVAATGSSPASTLLEQIRIIRRVGGSAGGGSAPRRPDRARQQIMELVSPAIPARTSPPTSASASARLKTTCRAAVMKKTGSHSLSALIRLALAADPSTAPQSLR